MSQSSTKLSCFQSEICSKLRNLLVNFPDRREETFLQLVTWIGLSEASRYFSLVESESEVDSTSFSPEL
jgi:hypothetical protein